ncbi:MAG: DUF3343 domain-containing protein [Oscillospiraceae bacterium]|nr:DUF3343 domain-containing protein [Oscillospiraceae bacterium]
MTYIATFYSHFGAIRFKKLCEANQMPARLMPVPRSLSSSCGTCVRYEGGQACPGGRYPEEVEQVVQEVQEVEQGYRSLYRAKDS